VPPALGGHGRAALGNAELGRRNLFDLWLVDLGRNVGDRARRNRRDGESVPIVLQSEGLEEQFSASLEPLHVLSNRIYLSLNLGLVQGIKPLLEVMIGSVAIHAESAPFSSCSTLSRFVRANRLCGGCAVVGTTPRRAESQGVLAISLKPD
jgi:hypothetical protein